MRKLRKTGIDIIGDVPWGTHFCQFYQSKEDLIDILIPYFKSGLENNEFCLWVTSEPLGKKEAEEAMEKALPDFELYLKRGQIEIIPYTEWYIKDGALNLQRVINGWIDKLNLALARGYDGMKATGNIAWLEKKDWESFTDYEKEINSVIGKYRIIAICTYSLDKCGANEIIDVVRNHQFTLIRRGGKWELVESSERKLAEEALRESEEHYRMQAENTQRSKDAFFSMLEDINESYKELEDLFMSLVKAMVNALDAKSPWTKGHSVRVAEYAEKIAKEIGLDENELKNLRLAGLLHDIGKIGTYDNLLDKPAKLTDEEFDLVKRHPAQGATILTDIKQLKDIIPLIRHHHERIDGRGYPDGLKGEKIPLGARILHVADSFDSMTADRPYRSAPGKEYALLEFKRCNGTQFDPQAVEAFLRVLSKSQE